MNVTRGIAARAGALGLALASGVALSACGSDNNAGTGTAASGPAPAANCSGGSISGAGSSFQAPMQQQWAKDWAARCAGAKVNYQSVGSGAGVEQFGSGTVDFAGSDVLMKAEEQRKANAVCASPAVHAPITAGGVAVTYNLEGAGSLNLSPQTLAAIFSGRVKTWNDPAIAAENSNATLPSLPITVFHRSDASGTTAVFTEFLATAAKGAWTLGSGKSVEWRAGQGAKGNEGVTAGVKQTRGGITYTEQSYAVQNRLPMAKVKNAGGQYVELTSANVSRALEAATVTASGSDVRVKPNYAPANPSAYPISTVSYAIVCSKYANGAKGKAVGEYLAYAVRDGQAAADRLGFAPLPSSLATKVKATLASIG